MSMLAPIAGMVIPQLVGGVLHKIIGDDLLDQNLQLPSIRSALSNQDLLRKIAPLMNQQELMLVNSALSQNSPSLGASLPLNQSQGQTMLSNALPNSVPQLALNITPTGVNNSNQSYTTGNEDKLQPLTSTTKMLSDAAMLVANDMVGNPMNATNRGIARPALAGQAYDEVPKLMNNQKIVLQQPQDLMQLEHSRANPVMTQMQPIIPGQLSREEILARLDTSNQSITPNKPIMSTYQQRNSGDMSTPLTASYINENEKQTGETNPLTSTALSMANKLSDRLGRDQPLGQAIDMMNKSGVTQSLVTKGLDLLASGFKKLIGDDVVGKVGPRGYEFRKVIGDDPPDGLARKEELDAAYTSMASSILFEVASKLIVIEQLLQSEYTVKSGRDSAELARDIRTPMVAAPILYNFVQSNTIHSLTGSNYYFDNYPAFEGGTTNAYVLINVPYKLTHTKIKKVDRSIPLVGNVTWQQLRPLMNNTSIAEFSSALRIKVRANDLDVMANLMAQSYAEIEAQSGYSFSSKLAKLLGYLSICGLPMRRDEGSVIGIGLVPIYPSGGLEPEPLTTIQFPWNRTYQGTKQSAQDLGMVVGAASFTTFLDLMLGRVPLPTAVNNVNVFDPQAWNNDVAVVMIRQAELNEGMSIFARTLAELDFPACRVRSIQNVTWVDPRINGSLIQLPSVDHAVSWISMSHILGPTLGVLYVVIDYENPLPTTGFGIKWPNTDIIDCAYPTAVNVPNLSNDLVEFFQQSWSSVILSEIRLWEEIYGTSSDRCSAFRWVAENSMVHCFKPVELVTQAGVENVISGLNFVADPREATGGGSYLQPYSQKTFNGVQGGAKWCQTPLGEFREDAILQGGPPRVDVANPIFKYSLGGSLPQIDLLLHRGWLRPIEEYPMTRLWDRGTVYMALMEAADNLSVQTDLILNGNDVDLSEWIWGWENPSTPQGLAQQNYLRMHLENNVLRAIRQVPMAGIQYPSFFMEQSAWSAGRRSKHAGATDIANLVTVCESLLIHLPSNRVPAPVCGKYSPRLTHSNPVISFGRFGAGQRYVQNTQFYGTDVSTPYYYVENVRGDMERMLELRKLSFAFLGTADKNLANIGLVGKSLNTQTMLMGLLDLPAPWFNIQLMYANLVNGTASTTNECLPLGFFVPNKCVRTGGDQYLTVLLGPRDAFAKNTQTSSIYTVLQNGGLASLVGAPIINEFDTTLYAPQTIESTMSFL